MAGLDDFARRAIRKSQYAKKMKAKRDEANKTTPHPDAVKDTGFRSSLSAAQRWAIDNPDMAKYDNDGNPVNAEHWGF